MSGFEQHACHPITGIHSDLFVYQHSSGLVHYHLANKDPHRAASIALRTVPADNSGVAHILEHSVLCGSKQFPVRDPFFMMLRRSMQTFMNAMTSDDCTWYPFATKNLKDFYNLLGIYSDAVFNPRLHPLDIAQEGHRWSLTQDGPRLAGIVYNEMKGAYDDADHILYRALLSQILPDTIYRFESGGDPVSIPDLSVDAVKAFHQRYYQSHNACLCTYGDLDTKQLHDEFERYLPTPINSHQATQINHNLYLQQPKQSHKRVIVETPCEAGAQDEEHVVSAWLCGDSSDPIQNCQGMICESLLLGHAGSPLRQALESSPLCQSIDGSGYIDYCRNGIFSIEAHACKREQQPELADFIKEQLRKKVNRGFLPEDIADAIKQQEMQDRYIGGDRNPFGLQLCESLIDAWIHGASPKAALDTDTLYKNIWQHYQDNPRFFDDFAHQHFIDQAQHVELFSCNNPQFSQPYADNEQERIALLQDDHIEVIKQLDQALDARREQQDDPHILPKIAVADIPADADIPTYSAPLITCPSNGISYLNLIRSIDQLTHDDVRHMHVLNKCIGYLDDHQLDYQSVGSLFNKYLGAHHASTETWYKQGAAYIAQSVEAWGLSKDLKQMHQHLTDHIRQLHFNNQQRLNEIIQQEYQNIKDRIIQSPQIFASYEAAARCHSFAAFHNRHRGLPYFYALQTFKQNPEQCQHILSSLHQRCHLDDLGVYIYQDKENELAKSLSQATSNIHSLDCPEITTPNEQSFTAYPLASSVHYIALALPAPEWTHPDASILYVCGNLLQNVYLHKQIRELGGAYGASAYYHASNQTFLCGSYRDPHLDQSIDCMLQSLRQLQNADFDHQILEEAIVSSIAEFDRPASPFTEAKRCMLRHLRGEDPALLHQFRKRVLACDNEDIRRCAQEYLLPQHAQVLCFGDKDAFTNSAYNWSLKTLFND